MAVLCEAGEVELGVMRRGAKNEAQKCANDWGQDTTRDSFWFLKFKEGALYGSSTADDSAEWASSQPRVGVQSGVLARATHGDGSPRSPLTGARPRSPRYASNRNDGDGDGGVTGTGCYGGWAYGVPVRTGVRD